MTRMNGQRRRGLARVPDPIWAPASAGLVMLAVGLMAVLAGEPWIFPSLGPTAFMQSEFPGHRTTDLYHTVVGHLIGIGAGIGAVLLLGAADVPAVDATGRVAAVRVWAAALSVAATILVALLLRASHPPAASTTLLFALGALQPTLREAALVTAGVLLVAVLGQLVRLVRLPDATETTDRPPSSHTGPGSG